MPEMTSASCEGCGEDFEMEADELSALVKAEDAVLCPDCLADDALDADESGLDSEGEE